MKRFKKTSIIITLLIIVSTICQSVGFAINYPTPTRAIYFTLPTMKGEDVKWVQEALNTYGNYGLAVDGSFGPACKEATKKFQASRGLAQDGSFGPATRNNMISWLNGRNGSSSVVANGKSFYRQTSGGCYTASAAMIMTNIGATWNGSQATYWNVYAANGNTVYLSGSTPGKFGCNRWWLNVSKSSVVEAIKRYPQGVMVEFYQPSKGWNHCMVAVGLNSAGEPLFYDPAMDNGSNGGSGYTLNGTTAHSWGGASWSNLVNVSVIEK